MNLQTNRDTSRDKRQAKFGDCIHTVSRTLTVSERTAKLLSTIRLDVSARMRPIEIETRNGSSESAYVILFDRDWNTLDKEKSTFRMVGGVPLYAIDAFANTSQMPPLDLFQDRSVAGWILSLIHI